MNSGPDSSLSRRPGPGDVIEIDPFASHAQRPAAPQPHGPHRAHGPAVTLRSILRFKWSMLAICLLIAAPAATAIWMSSEPLYRAAGEIHVDPVTQKLIYETELNRGAPNFEKYVNTQVSTIMTASVLNAVLDDPAVRSTQWYTETKKSIFGAKLSRLERIKDALDVKVRGGTNVLDVAFTCGNAEEGATIVNSVLDHYIEHTRQVTEETAADRARMLNVRKRDFEQSKKGFEETIARLTESLQGGSPEALFQTATIDKKNKESQLDDLARDRRLLAMKLQDLEEQEKAAAAGSATSQPVRRYDEDIIWRMTYDSVRAAREELDALYINGFSDQHMKVRTARSKLESRERELAEREKILDERPPGLASGNASLERETPASLKARIKEIDRRSSMLNDSLAGIKDDVNKLGRLVAALEEQKRELGRKEAVLNEIENKQTQLQVESGAPGSISIQARAFPPTVPANATKRLMYVAMACFAGIALGLLSGYLRASFSPIVADAEEMTQASNSPFLGYLPWVNHPDDPRSEEHVFQIEAVRVVRTALLERLKTVNGRAVLITSAGPSAGKTTLATLLARSLAACGKRVLLIDADLRRPSVSSRLKIASGPGLLAVLRGRVSDIRSAIVPVSSTLHVLPADVPIADASETEALANGVFGKQLDHWRKEYDIVVFDAPPVLPVADASILARQVDGTIFVVREGRCRRSDITDALAGLRSAGADMIGSVVFGSSRSGRYGGSYYSYYRPLNAASSGLAVIPPDESKS